MKDMQGKKRQFNLSDIFKTYLSEAYRKIRWDTN